MARIGVVVVASLASTLVLHPEAGAGAATVGMISSGTVYKLPSFVRISPGSGVLGPRAQSQTVTDTPGNVYYQAPPLRLVASPMSDPADLIGATASDDGHNITLSSKSVRLNNPMTDPNWRNNTYMAWAIDPDFKGSPKYFVYFQLSSDGSYHGVLTYATTNTPVSCAVTLAFNDAIGYQARLSTACLPGVTSFQWFAYSLYDTVPVSQDPNGSQAFGKALPDFRRNGGKPFAPPVKGPRPAGGHAEAPGYWLFARDGGVFSFGGLRFFGSEGGARLNQPVVGGAATIDGQGYWLVAADGGVFAFGDARFYGSTGGFPLNSPIVALVTVPTGTGYWLVAADGGVFSFGNAGFFGSTGALNLNQPVVGAAATSDGRGYWLVARDGGVFAFGDAKFRGSTGGVHLNRPVVGIVADSTGGYWLAASDGGIFAFGGAPFFGSTGSLTLTQPVEGMAATSDYLGYRLVATDGGVFAFGDAGFFGSTGGFPLNQPVVGLASVG